MTRRIVFTIIPLLLVGCMQTSHRPVMVKAEEDIECPEWAVLAEVDGRFYCIDRRFFEDGGSHDQ